MNNIEISFTNSFAPAGFVRYGVSLTEAPLQFYQTPDAIYVSVAANAAFVVNPTKDLLDRIADLKKRYSHRWLSNSATPSDAAFQNARDFVLTLPLNQISRPAIHVASDGEVNFHWDGPDFNIDLGFYGNGLFSYYGAKDGIAPVVGEAVPVKDGAPPRLLEIASAS